MIRRSTGDIEAQSDHNDDEQWKLHGGQSIGDMSLHRKLCKDVGLAGPQHVATFFHSILKGSERY